MDSDLELLNEALALLRRLRSVLFTMPESDMVRRLISEINDIEDRANLRPSTP